MYIYIYRYIYIPIYIYIYIVAGARLQYPRLVLTNIWMFEGMRHSLRRPPVRLAQAAAFGILTDRVLQRRQKLWCKAQDASVLRQVHHGQLLVFVPFPV